MEGIAAQHKEAAAELKMDWAVDGRLRHTLDADEDEDEDEDEDKDTKLVTVVLL